MSFYVVLSLLVFSWFLVMWQYVNFMPRSCRVNNDPIRLILTIVGGITEPMNIKFFKYGIAGKTIKSEIQLSFSNVHLHF